ncbi:MAG: hypothetical protein U1E02_03345, partial [Hydrogenophaga sp.]|nr:hypothetical protein [Hydrogenophaga sp.]
GAAGGTGGAGGGVFGGFSSVVCSASGAGVGVTAALGFGLGLVVGDSLAGLGAFNSRRVSGLIWACSRWDSRSS